MDAEGDQSISADHFTNLSELTDYFRVSQKDMVKLMLRNFTEETTNILSCHLDIIFNEKDIVYRITLFP